MKVKQLHTDIIITSIGHFLVHSITMILPAILILLEKEFSISLISLGKLATIQVFFLGIGGFPSGILTDKFGSRFVLIIYFLGIILSSIWLYFSYTFNMVAIGLGFLGLITGLYHPAGLKVVSHAPNISRYMSYHGVFGSLGLATGPIYGVWMSNWLGWRIAYLLLSFLAFIGIIIIFLSNREISTVENKVKLNFRFNRSQIIIISVASLWGLAHHGLFNFLPYYFNISVQTIWNPMIGSGLLTGFVLLIGIVGQLLGGRLGEYFPRKKIYVFVVALNIPFLILMAFYNGWVLVGIVATLGAINFMFQPINNSLLADVTNSSQRGVMYGFSAGISFGIGSLSGLIGGYIGEYISINYIFPIISLFLIPAIFLAIILKKIL